MLMKLPLHCGEGIATLSQNNGYKWTLLFNLDSLFVDIGIGACHTFAMVCLSFLYVDRNNSFSLDCQIPRKSLEK